MLPDVLYRGYRVTWDAWQPPGSFFWSGKAAITSLNDSGLHIYSIQGSDYFLSPDDARDHLISAAKEWIDNEIAGKKLPVPLGAGARRDLAIHHPEKT